MEKDSESGGDTENSTVGRADEGCSNSKVQKEDPATAPDKDAPKQDSVLAKLMQPSGDRSSDEEETVPEKADETAPETAGPSETVDFKVIFNKTKHEVTWELDKTVLSLKNHIQTLTKVAPSMQKIMFKGLAKDEKTLRELGITKGSKVMMVGSKLQDVISVNAVSAGSSTSTEESSAAKREPLSKQKPHAKVIEKGPPEDVMPGYANGQERLPATPLKGMMNKHGNKVRLTFKLEADQLWLGTKDRTEKLPLSSIKDIISEKIADHPGYHMVALQLGPTEQSRYWIYWVPSQYVEAIKDAILGKWQMF